MVSLPDDRDINQRLDQLVDVETGWDDEGAFLTFENPQRSRRYRRERSTLFRIYLFC